MLRRYRWVTLWLTITVLLLGTPTWADTELTLKKSFVLKYKNRLTIEAEVQPIYFSKIHPRGDTGSDDGDIHIAVLPSAEIGLATVIEIQNADDAKDAIRALTVARDGKKQANVLGVWRLWAEHGGDHRHTQGVPISAEDYPHSNPDHVFEVHPVLRVGDLDLKDTVRPIEGFTAPDSRARDAFQTYEDRSSEIKALKLTKSTKDGAGNVMKPGDYIRLKIGSAGYNYVKFLMRKIEGDHGYETAPKKWAQPEDGLYLFVEIYDPNGPKDEPLVRKRRIGFVKGTKPYEKAANLETGQCMLVLGMPRLNLELVAWRLGLGVTKPHDASVLKWNVPYEMVIVGIYDDQPKPCGPGRE